MSETGGVPDRCPECGAVLLGFDRDDYLDHLKLPGHLSTRIREEMVVGCADANPVEAEGCADANGGER